MTTLEQHRRYRETHREVLKERKRVYYQANKEKWANGYERKIGKPWLRYWRFASHSNVMAQKYGCEGRLVTAEVRAIEGFCVYCGGIADEWDHAIPLRHRGLNRPENVVPCCRNCNRRKNCRTPEQWRNGEKCVTNPKPGRPRRVLGR